MAEIEDGTGTGSKLRIDSGHRARVFAVSEDLLSAQQRSGKSFYISTGVLDYYDGTAVTTTTEYIIADFKNTTSGNILISRPEFWSDAGITGTYTETADQWVRINQWLSPIETLEGVGANAIVKNLNVTIFRTSNVYGKHKELHFAGYNIINHFINLAQENKDLVIFGDGSTLQLPSTTECAFIDDRVGEEQTALKYFLEQIGHSGID